MVGVGWVSSQFLPESQDMVIYGARRRIVLVTQDLFQQFVPQDDPLFVVHEEL
jgi:hypothetical protein